MVNGVHRDTADARSAALPPAAPSLAELDVALLGVADLTDGGPAGRVHPTNLTRGHPQVSLLALLGQQLDAGTRRARDLRAAARPQLDRVNDSARRDIAQRQAVTCLNVRARTVLYHVALAQAARRDDVALLAVRVVQQRDPRGPVRAVLDWRDFCRDTVLVGPPEVDYPVGALVPATLVPGRDPAMHIPAAPPVQRADQRLLRLAPGHFGEVRAARTPPARSRRLVLADGHVCSKLLCSSGRSRPGRRCRSARPRQR